MAFSSLDAKQKLHLEQLIENFLSEAKHLNASSLRTTIVREFEETAEEVWCSLFKA